MPRRPRMKSKSGIYHVIVRGGNRQEIFHNDSDRVRFLAKLKQFAGDAYQVLAWCLMDNHVHLLIKENEQSISLLMKRLGISYAYYYNSTYATNGHLFQDRFKSEVVESAVSLMKVLRYIHMNPVKAGMVSLPEDFPWSSCRLYFGQSGYPMNLLESSLLLNLFSSKNEVARKECKAFHEQQSEYEGLSAWETNRRRITDEEARVEVLEVLGDIEIPQVKSLPGEERDTFIRKLKKVRGISKSQLSRILGISIYLVNKA